MLEADKQGAWPWYLYGRAGGGKSCAMACVYSSYRGRCAWIVTSTRLPEFVSMKNNGEIGPLMNTLRDFDLICLDDVGVREPTPAQMDMLLLILETRAGLPLIITGNVAPDKLADVLDNRVASRICAGSIIEIESKDRRLEKALWLKA